MVNEGIKGLVQYGLNKGLIKPEDAVYAINQILDVLHMDEYEEPKEKVESENLESILKVLMDYAYETGVLSENSVVYRDLFDTRLMNCLMPRPSEVIKEFWSRYETSAKEATNFFISLARTPIISAVTGSARI